jgi:hypothetical protein
MMTSNNALLKGEYLDDGFKYCPPKRVYLDDGFKYCPPKREYLDDGWRTLFEAII